MRSGQRRSYLFRLFNLYVAPHNVRRNGFGPGHNYVTRLVKDMVLLILIKILGIVLAHSQRGDGPQKLRAVRANNHFWLLFRINWQNQSFTERPDFHYTRWIARTQDQTFVLEDLSSGGTLPASSVIWFLVPAIRSGKTDNGAPGYSHLVLALNYTIGNEAVGHLAPLIRDPIPAIPLVKPAYPIACRIDPPPANRERGAKPPIEGHIQGDMRRWSG